jgi:hypothetical protein
VRFFVDNNLSPVLVSALTAIIPGHEYCCARDEGLSDTLDIPLFGELVKRSFDVIITRDKAQLEDDGERTALIESGLHWLGVTQAKVGGLVGIALDSAAITTGIAIVLPELVAGPQRAYRVKAVPREASQRMTPLSLHH